MGTLTDKRKITKLITLCIAVYFVSYITRLNYGAVVSAFVTQEGISKDLAAIPITLLSITYGIGQLVSGVLGDKIAPNKIITFGLTLTTIMNFTMPLTGSIIAMCICWCINGFAQAMIWPPLVKIMTSAFDSATYKKAVVYVSYGSSAGTIAIYLAAPLCVLQSWRLIFYICAACSAIMIVIWNVGISKVKDFGVDFGVSKCDVDTKRSSSDTKAIISAIGIPLIFIMLAIVFQGMIRDGVTTWMPSYIKETYHLGDTISVLTGVVMPIFSIISFKICAIINKKLITNEITCACVLAGASIIFTILLTFFTDGNAIISIILSGLTVACMHGVNLMLVCMLPSAFSKYGNVSTISGILNFGTYVGSAISNYGFAVIAERSGWNTTILLWAIIAGLTALCCAVCINSWRKFKES